MEKAYIFNIWTGEPFMPALLFFYPALLLIHPSILSLFFLIFFVFQARRMSRALASLWAGKVRYLLALLFQLISLFWLRVGFFFLQLQKSPQLLPGMGHVLLELVIHASFDFKLFTTMLSVCEWAWGKINVWKGQSRQGRTALPAPFSWFLVFLSVNSSVFKFRNGLFWNKWLLRSFPEDLCVI